MPKQLVLSGNEAMIICVLAGDFFRCFSFPTPCIWIFLMGRRYCESEGKCTGCQAHNGIILLFQYVCVSLCKERWWGQRTETFSAGRQGSAMAQHRAALWCPFCSALVCTARDSHCHTLCPRKMGEACTAIHYAACKPHKAKYSLQCFQCFP